jgi:hypothetical protein
MCPVTGLLPVVVMVSTLDFDDLRSATTSPAPGLSLAFVLLGLAIRAA